MPVIATCAGHSPDHDHFGGLLPKTRRHCPQNKSRRAADVITALQVSLPAWRVPSGGPIMKLRGISALPTIVLPLTQWLKRAGHQQSVNFDSENTEISTVKAPTELKSFLLILGSFFCLIAYALNRFMHSWHERIFLWTRPRLVRKENI